MTQSVDLFKYRSKEHPSCLKKESGSVPEEWPILTLSVFELQRSLKIYQILYTMWDKSIDLVKISDGCHPWSQQHPSLVRNVPEWWPFSQLFKISQLFPTLPIFSQFFWVFHSFFQVFPSFPNCSQISKLFITFPNFSKISQHFQTFSNFSKLLPVFLTFSNISNFWKLFQTFPSFSQLFPTLPDFCQLFPLFLTFPKFSKLFQMIQLFPAYSLLVKNTQLNLSWA